MKKNLIAWIAKVTLLAVAVAIAMILTRAWRQQADAPLHCQGSFGPLTEHNGYFQVNLLRQHPTEPYFDAEVFVLYATAESPPPDLKLALDATGRYGTSIAQTNLISFGDGMSTPKPLGFSLPTPNVSQRLFPFDSPTFDLSWRFEPPQRPKVVMFRNYTPDFIPACDTFASDWDGGGKLRLQVQFRRNPFVQASVVIVGLAALVFGLLLGQIGQTEDLATATASYFFSLWSIRGIIAPAGVSYPTLLDFWLMGVSILVLFVVAWRLLPRGDHGERAV